MIPNVNTASKEDVTKKEVEDQIKNIDYSTWNKA